MTVLKLGVKWAYAIVNCTYRHDKCQLHTENVAMVYVLARQLHKSIVYIFNKQHP